MKQSWKRNYNSKWNSGTKIDGVAFLLLFLFTYSISERLGIVYWFVAWTRAVTRWLELHPFWISCWRVLTVTRNQVPANVPSLNPKRHSSVEIDSDYEFDWEQKDERPWNAIPATATNEKQAPKQKNSPKVRAQHLHKASTGWQHCGSLVAAVSIPCRLATMTLSDFICCE